MCPAEVSRNPHYIRYICRICQKAIEWYFEDNEEGPRWIHTETGDEWCHLTKAIPLPGTPPPNKPLRP